MKKNRLKFNPIIQTTYNYGQFKQCVGNRDLNESHLRKLKQSMIENPLQTFIIVNERYEVIDGQHRLKASQELGLPINYIVVYGYGVKEVSILNTNHNNWKKNNYLQTYCDLGYENYIQFQKFQKDFPKLNFSLCLKLMSGLRSNKTQRIDGYKTNSKEFENGQFVVTDLEKAYDLANKIMDIEPYFKRFNDNTFCLAFMSVYQHPNYEHNDMLHKLKVQPNTLSICRSQEQYVGLLEQIYNYKRGKKVSLVY
jgi:hypothetical protein